MFSFLPAFGIFDGAAQQPETDSHLNTVSIEYPEDEVCTATKDFDPASMLGSGTFGSVYKGTMRDGTEVAIKVLKVPQEAGFEEEVKVLSRFRHPNLVILMGFSRHTETGGRSLIYEYLAGGDASRRLQRSRSKVQPYDYKQRISTALDAASGLSHLHNANPRAFHRDIKGPNILLDKNGTAKMADFGLSCVSQSSHHKVQQASGTVGYACPEYIRTGVINEGSEVHSFGMVLLELLTGAPPAVQRPDKPSEFCYLVDHLQGSVAKVIQLLDQTGNFPLQLAERLTGIAFDCIMPKSADRPSFVQLLGVLRRLFSELEKPDCSQQSGLLHTTEPSGQAPPLQGVAHELPFVPAGLLPGQVIEARWQGSPGWFRGRILRANPNNTFAIRYDEHDYEDQVPMHHIRQLEPSLQAGAGEQDRCTFLAPAGLQPAGGSSSSSALPERAPGAFQAVASCGKQDWHGRLFCVFAEGVSDLGRLNAQQRAVEFPRRGNELFVGRTVQPTSFWDALVPDARLRGTVSREHFKIIREGGLAEQQLPTFSLLCLSANGLLLNGNFVRNTDGLQRFQHGDIVAFGTDFEVAHRGPLDERGATGPLSRKPFVAFTFELTQTSLAATELPASQLALQACEEENEMPAPKPPKDTIAGSWRSSKASSVSRDSIVFCLEVHGDNVRRDLPIEVRQLLYCLPSSGFSNLPALRVGRHYQRDFWRRVMKFGVASQFLDLDHFEVVVLQRSSPAVSESLRWHCRVRVLASAGLIVNNRTLLKTGEELELCASDILTVATLPAKAENSQMVSQSLLRGLHFTFIPYSGSFGTSCLIPGVPQEASQRLPDFLEPEADGDGCLVVEKTDPPRVRSKSDGAAGALKPPTAVLLDGEGERTSTDGDYNQAGTSQRQGFDPLEKTVLLESMGGDKAEDDLFSKTGFGTSAE